jgi:hypothetical protein
VVFGGSFRPVRRPGEQRAVGWLAGEPVLLLAAVVAFRFEPGGKGVYLLPQTDVRLEDDGITLPAAERVDGPREPLRLGPAGPDRPGDLSGE